MPHKILQLGQRLRQRVDGILKTKEKEKIENIIKISKTADTAKIIKAGGTRFVQADIDPPFPRTTQKKVFVTTLETMDQIGIKNPLLRKKIAQLTNLAIKQDMSISELVEELSIKRKFLTKEQAKDFVITYYGLIHGVNHMLANKEPDPHRN